MGASPIPRQAGWAAAQNIMDKAARMMRNLFIVLEYYCVVAANLALVVLLVDYFCSVRGGQEEAVTIFLDSRAEIQCLQWILGAVQR